MILKWSVLRINLQVKPQDSDHQKKGDRNNIKMVSEVYLTRLLTTKVCSRKFFAKRFKKT